MTLAIAGGHNNAAGLKALHQLAPPLFEDYQNDEAIYTEWSSWDEMEADGERRLVPIGSNSVKWELFRVTLAEWAYLKATFGDYVTIRTLNKDTNTVTVYNATLWLPNAAELTYDRDTGQGFEDVVLQFWDLEVPA